MTDNKLPCPICGKLSEVITEVYSPYMMHKHGLSDPELKVWFQCPFCQHKGKPSYMHTMPDILGRTVSMDEAIQKAGEYFKAVSNHPC